MLKQNVIAKDNAHYGIAGRQYVTNVSNAGLGKAYLRLLVDEIKLRGNDLVVRGCARKRQAWCPTEKEPCCSVT